MVKRHRPFRPDFKLRYQCPKRLDYDSMTDKEFDRNLQYYVNWPLEVDIRRSGRKGRKR